MFYVLNLEKSRFLEIGKYGCQKRNDKTTKWESSEMLLQVLPEKFSNERSPKGKVKCQPEAAGLSNAIFLFKKNMIFNEAVAHQPPSCVTGKQDKSLYKKRSNNKLFKTKTRIKTC